MFCAGNSSASHLSGNSSGLEIPMTQGDRILQDKKVSLIKMDLEGGEEARVDRLQGDDNKECAEPCHLYLS